MPKCITVHVGCEVYLCWSIVLIMLCSFVEYKGNNSFGSNWKHTYVKGDRVLSIRLCYGLPHDCRCIEVGLGILILLWMVEIRAVILIWMFESGFV